MPSRDGRWLSAQVSCQQAMLRPCGTHCADRCLLTGRCPSSHNLQHNAGAIESFLPRYIPLKSRCYCTGLLLWLPVQDLLYAMFADLFACPFQHQVSYSSRSRSVLEIMYQLQMGLQVQLTRTTLTRVLPDGTKVIACAICYLVHYCFCHLPTAASCLFVHLKHWRAIPNNAIVSKHEIQQFVYTTYALMPEDNFHLPNRMLLLLHRL